MSTEQNAINQLKEAAPLLKTATENAEVISALAEQGLELDDEQLDNAIETVLKSPEVGAMIENVAQEAADDESLGAQINEAIAEAVKLPEIQALLENAAADAADDTKLAQGKEFDPAGTIPGEYGAIKGVSTEDRPVTLRDLRTFEAKVAAAFKHAGFKF